MNSTFSHSKMTDKEFIFDPDNKIDIRIGHGVVFGSIIGFGLLNIVVTKIGKPKRVKSDAWRWNNLLISWIHGLICGSWDILCLYLYPELFDDLIHHINYFTYLMVAFSSGYFIYDFLDLLLRRKLISNWEVTLHHVAVASAFYYNVHTKMCIGYNVLALMAEINSFFLHSRKLLHMLDYDFKDRFYLGVCMVNLLTFVIGRGFPLCLLSYDLFTKYDMVPWGYHKFTFCSIFVMNVINPILFWRLFRNDVLRNFDTKRTEKKVYENGNNNQPKHIKSS